MKKLIFQSYHANTVGSKTAHLGAYLPIDELAALSQRRMKAYAESIGADYILRSTPAWSGVRSHPAWTRWDMFSYWADYDELCYVDCDILPTAAAMGVSIFDYEGTAKFTERPEGSPQTWHLNAGVFKVSSQQALRLKNAIQGKKYVRMLADTGKNQEAFNECWKKTFGRKPSGLDPRWNATRPYHREGEYFFHHYIGAQKTKEGNGHGNLYTGGVFNWNLGQDVGEEIR